MPQRFSIEEPDRGNYPDPLDPESIRAPDLEDVPFELLSRRGFLIAAGGGLGALALGACGGPAGPASGPDAPQSPTNTPATIPTPEPPTPGSTSTQQGAAEIEKTQIAATKEATVLYPGSINPDTLLVFRTPAETQGLRPQIEQLDKAGLNTQEQMIAVKLAQLMGPEYTKGNGYDNSYGFSPKTGWIVVAQDKKSGRYFVPKLVEGGKETILVTSLGLTPVLQAQAKDVSVDFTMVLANTPESLPGARQALALDLESGFHVIVYVYGDKGSTVGAWLDTATDNFRDPAGNVLREALPTTAPATPEPTPDYASMGPFNDYAGRLDQLYQLPFRHYKDFLPGHDLFWMDSGAVFHFLGRETAPGTPVVSIGVFAYQINGKQVIIRIPVCVLAGTNTLETMKIGKRYSFTSLGLEGPAPANPTYGQYAQCSVYYSQLKATDPEALTQKLRGVTSGEVDLTGEIIVVGLGGPY